MVGFGRIVRAGTLTLALLALGACNDVYVNHGFVPSDEELAEITVGRDTRESVGDFLGKPSSSGVMADGGWYYVGSRWRKDSWRPGEEVSREVVAISFDENGKVSNVERFGLERGQVVSLSRRTTDSGISDIGFLRQLLGSVGNFAASDIVD